MSLQLEIVTPVKKVVSLQTETVKIPGYKGEMGVLNEHSSLVSAIDSGVVQFNTAEGEQRMAVRSGFAEVQPKKVVLLVDEAVTAKQVKKAEVEAKLKVVQEKLVANEVGYTERTELFKERDWLQACLAL